MALFALIAPADEPRLDAAVAEHFAQRHYKVAPGQFLVSATRLTTKSVAEKLKVYEGVVGRILIVRVSSYTGFHTRDLWEWLTVQEAPDLPSSDSLTGAGDA